MMAPYQLVVAGGIDAVVNVGASLTEGRPRILIRVVWVT